MCFTAPKEQPTFGELARDYHYSHVNEVRERSARLAAEERAQRLAERLGQDQADVIIAQLPRPPSPKVSPPPSPPSTRSQPSLQVSESLARRLLAWPTFGRSRSG